MEKTTVIRGSLFLILAAAMIFAVPFAIAQQSNTPQITVTLLNQNPDPVEQGDVVELRFKVENTGSSTSERVQLQLIEDYPFSIYTGSAVQDLGQLRAGQTGADAIIVRYQVRIDENAAEGDNEVMLRLRLGEGIWQDYTKNDFFVDVKDYDVPQIQVYVRETTVNVAGQRGVVTVEIANTDLADVKFLQMTLLPTEDYRVLSANNYAYIGDVDSDDTETEDFEIFVNEGVEGELILPVMIQYQDTNEKRYEETFSLKVNIYNSSELRQFGLKETNYSAIIGIVIVLAISALIYWRSRRKQR